MLFSKKNQKSNFDFYTSFLLIALVALNLPLTTNSDGPNVGFIPLFINAASNNSDSSADYSRSIDGGVNRTISSSDNVSDHHDSNVRNAVGNNIQNGQPIAITQTPIITVDQITTSQAALHEFHELMHTHFVSILAVTN